MPLNDLLSTLLALAGLIGATALGVLGELPLLADLLIGAGVGALIAKAVIGRLERGGRELPGPRVRQLDRAYIAAGMALALVINLAAKLL